jgi:hypothetical protein
LTVRVGTSLRAVHCRLAVRGYQSKAAADTAGEEARRRLGEEAR